MNLSGTGIALLKELEGFRENMYMDSAGLPTIGYGTLIDSAEEKKYLTETITEEAATAFLLRDVKRVEELMPFMVKRELKQCQYDAMVLFAYNVGTANTKGSTLLKMVNADPDDKMIPLQFRRWIYADHKPVEGLLNRRNREAALYFSEEKI